MSKIALGVDISKAKFDAALFLNNKFKEKKFDNNQSGFNKFVEWISKYSIQDLHVCMEATGIYGEALATFLFDAGFTVSVVNPAQVKGFAKSQLSRTKTDRADAKLIARFCCIMAPKPWQPKPAHVRELQALVRRLEALQDLYQQEYNREDVALDCVKTSIKAVMEKLEIEIKIVRQRIRDHIDQNPDMRDKKELLDTIPGVGEGTIAQVLAFMPIEEFKSARQLAAFIGLNPCQRQSGSSVAGRTRLSKIGNSRLRKALYMPAIVATRFNPTLKAFSERLKSTGKCSMLVIGATMRKLVHIIYGVLKSKTPFNAALAC